MRNLALLAGIILGVGAREVVWAQRDTSSPAPVGYAVSSIYEEQGATGEGAEVLFKPLRSAIYLACIQQSDLDADSPVPGDPLQAVTNLDDASIIETTFISADTP